MKINRPLALFLATVFFISNSGSAHALRIQGADADPTRALIQAGLEERGSRAGFWLATAALVLLGISGSFLPQSPAGEPSPPVAQQESKEKEKRWFEQAKKFYFRDAVPLPEGTFNRKAIFVVEDPKDANPEEGKYAIFFDAVKAARKDKNVRLIVVQNHGGGKKSRYEIPEDVWVVSNPPGKVLNGTLVALGKNLIAGFKLHKKIEEPEGAKGNQFLNNKLYRELIFHCR